MSEKFAMMERLIQTAEWKLLTEEIKRRISVIEKKILEGKCASYEEYKQLVHERQSYVYLYGLPIEIAERSSSTPEVSSDPYMTADEQSRLRAT